MRFRQQKKITCKRKQIKAATNQLRAVDLKLANSKFLQYQAQEKKFELIEGQTNPIALPGSTSTRVQTLEEQQWKRLQDQQHFKPSPHISTAS